MKNAIILVCKDLEGQVPLEIQVIPAGFHQTPKGDFLCDAEAAAMVINDFELQENDMVIDYEHQTIANPPVEAPAAGWIKKTKLINKGSDGIWAAIEWTEKAKQYIANKEYRYVSPVFIKRLTDNKVVRLINVALTNQPNIDGMVPLINKLDAPEGGVTQKEVTGMKGLMKLLGLPDTATEADAIAAVNKLTTQIEAHKAVVVVNKEMLDSLGLKDGATGSEIVGTIMAMKQSGTTIETLTKQVNKLEADLKKREAVDVEAMVNKAITDKKITPAQKDWALDYAKRDVEGFKVFVAKAPGVIITAEITGDDKGKKDALDASQVQVNKMMGIDTETYKKFGPKKEDK